MKKSSLTLLSVALLALSSQVFAQGTVTIIIKNNSVHYMSYSDKAAISAYSPVAPVDLQYISTNFGMLAPQSTVATVMEKTGPAFSGGLALTDSLDNQPYVVAIGFAGWRLDWSTKAGLTTFDAWPYYGGGAKGAAHNLACSPTSWNGEGDFTTTCTLSN